MAPTATKDVYESCVNFTAATGNSFKVDASGNWTAGSFYPVGGSETNVAVKTGWVKVSFDSSTKKITHNDELPANCGASSSSISSSSSSKSSSLSSSSSSSNSSSSSSISSSSKSSSSSSSSSSNKSSSSSSVVISSSSSSSLSSSSKSSSSSSVATVAHDFRTRTAYYVMLDRFENGDKTNDAGVSTAPAVDPVEWKKYWGGDIDGLISKLDYLKSLGVNAVVVSSLVDNTALGYHGFWGRDFYAVDENVAKNLAKVKELDKAMEDRGMKLVMEITLNNASNEKGEEGKLWKATDPVVTDLANGIAQGWYHDNGSIGIDGCTPDLCSAEQYDPAKYLTKSVSGRPDFIQGKTVNSPADEYLIGAAKMWMDNGVDGFRIHSTKFIEPSFVERFSAAVREKNADAYIFGDWLETAGDIPLAKAFVTAPHGVELMDIDLRDHLEAAIAGDQTMTELSSFIKTRQTDLGDKANLQAIYLDSYAESRTSVVLRAKTTEKTSRGAGKAMSKVQAEARQNVGVAMLLTLPGVPVIYYGTEANVATFTANTANEVGGDPFNREKIDFTATKKPAFDMIKALSELRSSSKAIQEGVYDERWVTKTGVGAGDVLVYQRKAADGSCAVVAINRGVAMTTSISVKKLCLTAGVYTDVLSAATLNVSADTVNVGSGTADITLKENQVMVFH